MRSTILHEDTFKVTVPPYGTAWYVATLLYSSERKGDREAYSIENCPKVFVTLMRRSGV